MPVFLRFFVRRLAVAVLILLGVSVLVFLMMQLLPPGMRTAVWIPAGRISVRQLEKTVSAYGLEEPLPLRYLLWMKSVLRGDFGYSASAGAPVSQVFGQYLSRSLPMLSIIFLAAALSPVFSGRFRGRAIFGRLTGVMLVSENLFGPEGIGWWLRQSVIHLDAAAVIFIALFTGLLSIAAGLAADLVGTAGRGTLLRCAVPKPSWLVPLRAGRGVPAAGGVIVLLFALMALFAPMLAPPVDPDMPYRVSSGGLFHGIVWGAGSAFKIVIPAVMGSLVIGALMGALSGFLRGIAGVERIFRAVPPLVMAAALVFALGRGLESIIIALIVLNWPVYAELVRKSIKDDKPLTALGAVASGSASQAGNTFLSAASLSFLGLGGGPAYADWGQMAASFGDRSYVPVLAIVLFVLGWKLAGIRQKPE
jgi:ABC-type dipeptide/oligopeptide/nickel transport system permease subunit